MFSTGSPLQRGTIRERIQGRARQRSDERGERALPTQTLKIVALMSRWKHSVPAGVNATDFVLSWISWMQHPKHIPDGGFGRGRISRDRPESQRCDLRRPECFP